MADPRTFTLIGEFQDGITPELTKINTAINTFKSNMMTMTSRRGGGFSDVTSSVGKLVSAQKHLKTAIEEVGAAAKSATLDLKDYKSMVGKVASAHFAMNKSTNATGQRLQKQWEGASEGVVNYKRKLQTLGRFERAERQKANRITFGGSGQEGFGEGSRTVRPRTPSTPRAFQSMSHSGGDGPRPSRYGGGDGPRPPRGGGGMGGGDGYNFHMGAFAFGMQLGQGISQPVTAAVLSGFQLGVGLLQQSFSYISNAFAERVKDQMTDLQAAGGYYAIGQIQKSQGKNPLVSSLQEAIMFTKDTNAVLAKLANDLPGDTQDYVDVSKRVGDSIARLIAANEKGAIEYAKQQRLRDDNMSYYKPVVDAQSATQVLLGELTKKAVMAGFGGSAGAGGQKGPTGLPALTERLLTDPTISIGKLSRYAAVFGDPKISSALERLMPNLEKAGTDMLSRLKAIDKFYDEVVPPEMVAALRRSLSGLTEAFRSSFLNPETGLLGFGRQIELGAKMIDEQGYYVKETLDKAGKKVYTRVANATEASTDGLAVFDMFSDILANFGAVVKPIVDNLTLLYDPMKEIGKVLLQAREMSINFLRAFRSYSKGIDEYAKQYGEESKEFESLMGTKNLRATLSTFAQLFKEFGVFGSGEFESTIKKLFDPKTGLPELGNILSEMVSKFFSSDLAKELGQFVGTLLGTIVVEISKMTGFLAKVLTGEELGEGFGKSFVDSGGVAALKQIFNDLYKLVWEAFVFAVKAMPVDLILKIGLATILVPAAISGVGMMIGQFMTELIGKLFSKTFSGEFLDKIITSSTNKNFTKGGKKITFGAGDVKVPGAGGAKVTGAMPDVTTGTGKEKLSKFKMLFGEESLLTKSVEKLKPVLSKARVSLDGLGPLLAKTSIFLDAFGDFMIAVVEKIPGIKQLADLLDPFDDDFNFKNPLPALRGKLQGLMSLVKDFIWTLSDDFVAGSKSFLGKVGSSIKNLDLLWIKGLDKFDEFLGAFIIGIDDFIIKSNAFFAKIGGALAAPARGGLDLKGRVGGMVQGAKGLAVRVVGVAKNVASGVKGGAGGILQGAKGFFGKGGALSKAGAGVKGFFGKGAQGLGKFGGAATAVVGIVEAISALLRGESLAQALGKGAGPVIGTIIGSAIAGPVGSIIGGMIGSMTGITDPLGKAFDSILSSFEPLASAIGTLLNLFGDAGKAIAGLFGQGTNSGFSGLAMVLEPIVKLFQLLEVGIRGLAVALKYVRMYITEWTGSEEEKIRARQDFYAEDIALKKRQGQMFAQENRSIADNEKERVRMFNEFNVKAKGDMKAAESAYYQDFLKFNKLKLEEQYKSVIDQKTADSKLKGLSDERRKALEEEVKAYKTKLASLKGEKPPSTLKKDEDKPKPIPPKKDATPLYSKPLYGTPGKPGFITLNGNTYWKGTDGTLTTVVGGIAPKKSPTKTTDTGANGISKPLGGVATEVVTTAKSTSDLNRKATTQLKETAAVKASTDRTTHAINNLAAKITSQSPLQTTVAAIYNLLASGTLRVLTNIKLPTPQVQPNPTVKAPPAPKPSPLPARTTTDSPIDRNSAPSVTSPAGMALGVAFGSPGKAFSNLAAAANYENKHKPAGSKLGVFNTSETVIPAAGGYGMADFVSVLRSGFATMIAAYRQAQQKQETTLNAINQTLISNQQQTNARLSKLETKFSTPSIGGLGGGSIGGGVDAITPIAQQFGLQMTSGYRPGDPGYHGANRARDFSNGTGPTPQMMQFAQQMASSYGSSLKELIYTPLGFSIKNGQVVPPYAQGSHYNHVHVAYATGFPTMFGSQSAALDWEKRATLGNVKVSSITARQGEFGGGGGTTINGGIHVSVQAGDVSDPDQLASLVAMKIGDAVAQARASSVFV